MKRMSLESVLDHWIPEPNTGCSLWIGGVDRCGYGVVVPRRTDGKLLGEVKAHRIAWVAANGPIASHLRVCHKCDTPACVRIEHLFLGTQTENVADMVRKGRRAKGSDYALAKLTDEKVRSMRAEYATGQITTRALAKRYGIGSTVTFLVVTGKRWKHA